MVPDECYGEEDDVMVNGIIVTGVFVRVLKV